MGERIHRLFDPDEKHQQLAPPCEDVPRKIPQEALAREGCRSRLFLSLLSGLPNEQDFVLGALGAGRGGPPLSPRLLEVLVAQAGVWAAGAALGRLYSECWRGVEGRRTRLFWRATLPPLLCATLGVDAAAGEEEEEPTLEEPWELRAEGRRVTQVALILHNLSFEAQNVSVLVNSAIFIRFLLLCIHCSWANLKQIAFDTLANIAEEVQLCGGEEADRLLLRVVLRGVVSGDRFVALRSMDALAQMAPRNDLLLAPQIDAQVCGRLVSLLSVRDVLLLHLALECLCALSELGRAPCDCIARTPGVAGALVSLLTLDPELQYGLGGMQVVEEEPCTAQVKRVVPPASPPPISKEVNSETFASNWLRGQYEEAGCGCSCAEDVYAAYVGFCGRAQRKGVLGAHAFAATLKSCFPQVELRQNSFLGLRKKGAEKTAVESPLLQAQLSAPPPEARLKVPRPPPPVVPQQQQVRCVPLPQVRKIAPQLNGRLQASSKTTSEPILRPVQKIQLPPEEPSRAKSEAAAEPSFILSGIQGNQVTYRLAGPADLALTNRLFVRSNGVAPRKEGEGVRSPLLNGLLDKRPPKRDILFHALVQNGIQAEPAPGGEGVVRMTAATQEGGVVRLHIESPENSNGPSDLSSLSDIAHTLECASEAIARTRDADSCLPPEAPLGAPLCKNVIVRGAAALPTNSVSGNTIRNVVVNAGTSIIRTLDTNSVASVTSGQSIGTVAMNSVAGNFVRTLAVNSGPGTLALNSISNNNIRTLAVNSMAGSVIRTLALNSVAGNLISQRSENVAVNSAAGNVLGQSVGTVVVNSVAGNVLSPTSLALNSVSGNVVRTLSMSSVAGQDVGTLSLNSVTGNVIKTVAVNSGAGNVNSIAGGRPGQQIFVVSSPGSGNPSIKFCILHTMPNSTEDQAATQAAGVVLGREPGTSQETPKRPSTPLSVVVKKPRTETPVKAEEEPSAVAAQTTSTKLEFICEWKNCRMRFPRPGQVLVHARSAHCAAEEGPCAWEGCAAGGRRRRLSLLTHLQDWHCGEGVLRQAAERRRGGAGVPPLPQPPPHPGYAPDAALVAIRRQHPKEPLVEEEEESAVAKSVRLTAALVLRNLVTHSERARTCVRRFEPELASAAMSSGEASKALAQCLAQLHHR